jgi:uncharacterized protein
MSTVFADTHYYLALLNASDRAHAAAVSFTRTFTGEMITTEWVITELADGLASPPLRKPLLRLVEALRNDPAVTVVPCDAALFERGYGLYAARMDKAWSLTDCISFVVMQDYELQDALTGDHHFEQAGFRILLT